MLEKDPWCHSSSGGFSVSLDGDSNRKTLCSKSDEDRTSNQCMISSNMDSIGNESCADDSILGDRAASVDNNLFYQLNNASHTNNDLSFLGNNLQDYGWPEIENFEEVDRMFRSCDSTFGLEIENDIGLGSFQSSHFEGHDDAMKSSFNFHSCDSSAINSVSQIQDAYGSNDSGMLKHGTDQKLAVVSLKRGPKKLTRNSSPNVMGGFEAVDHIENDPQIHSHIKQSKQQKPSEGKQKERSLENGDSFIHLDNLKEVGESNHSLNLQTPIILTNSHPSNKVLASPRSSIIKSEDFGLPSVSLRDSLYGSNQMQSMESSHEIPLQNPLVLGSKRKDRLHRHRLFGHLERTKLMVQKADSDPVSSQKQIPNFESEVESEVDGSDLGILGEMDSSNIQESSCISSALDELTIEASSFRQLQHVTEQLDIRTKLCIRDSLYRLARTAEQRHKCVIQTSGGRDDISDETNKCSGFMDMETDTNPIDRSIAHLLFHRPSDPFATATLDAVPTKSYTMVQAPNNGPVIAERPVCQEETTSANHEAVGE